MQGGLRRFPSSPASCGVHVEALGRRICVREAGLSPSFSLPIPQYFTQPCVGMPLSYWAHPLLPLGFFPSTPAEEVKGFEEQQGNHLECVWLLCRQKSFKQSSQSGLGDVPPPRTRAGGRPLLSKPCQQRSDLHSSPPSSR